jgi:hypothetical protein
MGAMARSKGARGEREIIDLLQPVVDAAYQAAGKVPPQLKRTSSMQADGGGCDVHGVDWLALEVKRCEALQVEAWWKQCVRQAKVTQLPVLVYRQNGRQWRARLPLYPSQQQCVLIADISIADFLVFFGQALQLQLAWQVTHDRS